MSDAILIQNMMKAVLHISKFERAKLHDDALKLFEQEEHNISRGLAILIHRDDQEILVLIASAAIQEGVLRTRLSSAHREDLFRAALKTSKDPNARFLIRLALSLALRQQGNSAEANEQTVLAMGDMKEMKDSSVHMISMLQAVVLGTPEDSERNIRELIPIVEELKVPGKKRATLTLRGYLANRINDQGRHEEALSLYLDVLKRQRDDLGRDNMITLITSNSIADCLLKLGRFQEAYILINSVIPDSKRKFGENHPTHLIHEVTLAESLIGLRSFENAKETLEIVLEKQTDVLGADHKKTEETENLLVSLADLTRDVPVIP